jgi:hypothetical protein
MQLHGKSVKSPLRKVLADSHVAAVIIALLLLWALNFGFTALLEPLVRLADFLFTAIAISDVPYVSRHLTAEQESMLINTAAYSVSTIAVVVAAYFFSHWVYGVGPLRSLSAYRTRLVRRKHA